MTSPPEVLLDELARARAAGEPFLAAWSVALAAAVATCRTSRERETWVAALEETRGAWGDAYARAAPTARSRAAGVIGRYRDALAVDDAEWVPAARRRRAGGVL